MPVCSGDDGSDIYATKENPLLHSTKPVVQCLLLDAEQDGILR